MRSQAMAQVDHRPYRCLSLARRPVPAPAREETDHTVGLKSSHFPIRHIRAPNRALPQRYEWRPPRHRVSGKFFGRTRPTTITGFSCMSARNFDVPQKPGRDVVFFHGTARRWMRDVRDGNSCRNRFRDAGVNACWLAPQLAVRCRRSSAGKVLAAGRAQAAS